MESRTDRFTQAQQELASQLGVDINNPAEVTLIRPAIYTEACGFINPAYRSCLDAHLQCLLDAKANGHEKILVLEDDFKFDETWFDTESEALTELESLDWQIVTLGYDLVAPSQIEGESSELQYWTRFDGKVLGSHAYMVTQAAYDLIIEHFERVANGEPGDHIVGKMGPDGALNTLTWIRNDAKRYLLKSNSVVQRPSASDCNPKLIHKWKSGYRALSKVKSLIK